jgi:hypothetical protein
MILFEPCVKRVEEGGVQGDGLAKLFEALAMNAKLSNESSLDLAVFYLEPTDKLIVGQYVPELHLVVRRIEETNA